MAIVDQFEVFQLGNEKRIEVQLGEVFKLNKFSISTKLTFFSF